MSTSEFIRMQIENIEAQLELLKRLIEKQSAESIVVEQGCQHPDDERVDVTTMGLPEGHKQFYCKACCATIEIGAPLT